VESRTYRLSLIVLYIHVRSVLDQPTCYFDALDGEDRCLTIFVGNVDVSAFADEVLQQLKMSVRGCCMPMIGVSYQLSKPAYNRAMADIGVYVFSSLSLGVNPV
jgi:hypothetical protein